MGAHRKYRDRKFAFGKQLLTLRTRAALTQSALAEAIGVHLRSVQNWEVGESYPKAETLQRLIDIFLSYQVFTDGTQQAEAQAFWSLAAEEGPHALAAFDAVWFARTLALHAGASDQRLERGQPPPPPPVARIPAPVAQLIDWGEALAVPTLHGRDSELATLYQWVVADRCRVVALVGIGGIGKSSLAITFARSVMAQFDVVLFRSLQNGPPLTEVLDQLIRAVSNQHSTLPDQISDKIALLVQLFRERRCLLILDNLETILQPGVVVGPYRPGYADYGSLLERLSERQHQSCLILTSREKPAELAPLEGRTAPVRALPLSGLDDQACGIILRMRDIVGTADAVGTLVHLYSGNPLALQLVTEPIRELFGGDVGAFLATGDAFFNGLGKLMEHQCARTTPLELAILYWLAIERELVPVSALLAKLGELAPKREVLVALESLRRRLLVERAADQPAMTLQPVILEFLTDQLVETVGHEIATAQPGLLLSHACVQATAKDYVRRSQERLIAAPLLERLLMADGSAGAVERRLLAQLDAWRDQPQAAQGYGPGNLVNLLRLLRGDLRRLNLADLAIRQAVLQGVDMQDSSLAGALLQDTVFSEAFDAILAVAVSSTGEYWAASSRRGEIRVWVAGGQTLHRVWRAHTDMVWALTLSPDGSTLASGSWDSTVKLWDVASGTLRWLGRHASRINRIVFAPDGHMLASSGNDATIRLWDAQTGTLLHVLPQPGPVIAINWSHAGRMLASGDIAGVIRLWELQTSGPPICVQTIQAHTVWVNGLVFAPDDRTLVSVSWDQTVKLWDISREPSAGVASVQIRETLTGHTDRVLRVDWSRDGRVLASSSRDQTLRLWDIALGRCRAVLRGHSGGADGLAFTPDSRTLISGSEDGTLRVWDVADGQCVRVMQGYAPFPYVVDWSPDSVHLISGGTDWLVTIWDTAEQSPARTLSGHSGVVCGVAWSADGQWLASSEWDNAIRLWEPASGACVRVLRHPNDSGNCFYDLAWSPDGRRLASGTNRHGVQVFALTAPSHDWTGRQFPTLIRHVAWSPTGVYLAGAGDDGIVYVWNPDEDTPAQQLAGHLGTVRSIAWSPDGMWLASGGGGERGELFVWDMRNGERVRTFAEHLGVVSAVTWSASGAVLVSGGSDGLLSWWDVQSGMCVREREAHQGTVQSLKVNPAGQLLASCGNDGAIMLWNMERGDYLQTFRRDRPYERLAITGIKGLTEAQKASLIALGAVDALLDPPIVAGDGAQSIPPVNAPSHVEVEQPNLPPPIPLHGLPLLPTSFIGRTAELAKLARMLADPACRLLTLIGPGGIGKTRLALQAAQAYPPRFTDGIAFVALAALDTPQIVAAISNALQLASAGPPDSTEDLLDQLRERHLLLILDSFEHLLASTDLVLAILQRAPHVTLLVTSHERLSLQAEWLFIVEGLAYPPEDPPGSTAPQRHADLNQYSAIQLFVQRARQVRPGLVLSEATLAAIAQICQHVAGMPLAIELAAANVWTLSIAAIEQQIRANLNVLATTSRDMPARHRSMRVVLDYTWRLLSERERVLLSRLAVFHEGCTAEAATAILSSKFKVQSSNPNAAELRTQNSELRTLLMALVEKSLVRQVGAPARSTDDRSAPTAAAPRFRLHGPIRAYAIEQLAARGELQALQRAHSGYYLALIAAIAAHPATSTSAVARAQLDREHENLRAALQWAYDHGDRTLSLRLAEALRTVWLRSGSSSQLPGWLAELLAPDDPPRGQA